MAKKKKSDDVIINRGNYRFRLDDQGHVVDEIPCIGRYRIQIVEQGHIKGDSGWKLNTIVNGGFQSFLQFAMIGSAGSKTVTHAAIGTGTVPGATDTTLNGELVDAAGCRCAITTGTTGSKTVTFTFTLASNVITAAKTIQNVGLFNGSTTNVGSMFAGNTYTTSALATNQAVNGTYQISFA